MSTEQEQTLENREVIEISNPPVEDNITVAAAEQQIATPAAPKLTRFQEDIKEILVELSEKSVNDIKESFKKGMILISYVDEKAGKTKQLYKDYVPITFKKSRAITKAMKKSRQLKEELNLKDKNDKPQKLDINDIKSRYGSVLPSDVDEEDIKDKQLFDELMTHYVIQQKAKIYFGIDDIDNYALNDLAVVIGLYELRNNFTPY